MKKKIGIILLTIIFIVIFKDPILVFINLVWKTGSDYMMAKDNFLLSNWGSLSSLSSLAISLFLIWSVSQVRSYYINFHRVNISESHLKGFLRIFDTKEPGDFISKKIRTDLTECLKHIKNDYETTKWKRFHNKKKIKRLEECLKVLSIDNNCMCSAISLKLSAIILDLKNLPELNNGA